MDYARAWMPRWIRALVVTTFAVGGCLSDGQTDQESAPPSQPPSEASTPYPRESELTRTLPDVRQRPGYLETYVDERLGTKIQRVSDQSVFGTNHLFLRHFYARNQPWNADGTLLLLGLPYPGALIDANTFRLIRWIHQPQYAVWSHNDPTRTIGTHQGTNRLVSSDVRADGGDQLIHEFTEYSEISFGAGEGNISNDDRYIALFGFGGGETHLIVFNLVARQTVGRYNFGASRVCDCPDPGSINNATMSQSGNYVVVQYNERGFGRHQGIEVFDRNLAFQRQLTGGSQHGDVGLTLEGEDVWVSFREGPPYEPSQDAAAYAWRLRDGAATGVIPMGTPGGHISCRNTRRPGYCYASHSRSPDNGLLANDQIYAFPLDGSMRMQVFAYQHSTCGAYARQAQGVPNHDGTQVLWASDWDDGITPVYTYIATKNP